MNVDELKNSGRTLRWKLRRLLADSAQFGHLLRGEQLLAVRPAFDALFGSHAGEAAARLQHFQPLPMLGGAGHWGFPRQVLAQVDAKRTDKGFANDRTTLRLLAARGQ